MYVLFSASRFPAARATQGRKRKKRTVKTQEELREIKEPKNMHSPGIEPGPTAWQTAIIPLDYECW